MITWAAESSHEVSNTAAWIGAGASLALFAATVWLVKVTNALAPRPNITAGLWIEDVYAWLEIANTGTAAAADINVLVTYVAKSGPPIDEYVWRSPSLGIGERIRFNVPTDDHSHNMMSGDRLAATVQRITIRGQAVRGRRRRCRVNLAINDFPSFWESQKQSRRRLRPPAPAERTANELELIRKRYTSEGPPDFVGIPVTAQQNKMSRLRRTWQIWFP